MFKHKLNLDNIEQVQIEFWEMDTEKVNFLNEEIEKFISRWSQNLVYVGSFS